MTTCATCGTRVLPCPEYQCRVRYHHVTGGQAPDLPSPHMKCNGWIHSNGYHMCAPAEDHTLLATAAA